MMLTDLADVCRAADLEVAEVGGWKSRGHGDMSTPRTIVCHHTAGPTTGNMPSLNTITYGRSDLPGPLCHLGLGRDGTVYVVAAGLAYHAGEVRDPTYANRYAIGIEAEATGRDRWPAIQLDAYTRLCRALCDHYGIGVDRVLGHKEVCAPVGRKVDPNLDMAAFRRRVTALEDDMPTADEIAEAVQRARLNSADGNSLGRVLGFLFHGQRAIVAALAALAESQDETVRTAVQEALADAVVDVDINVNQKETP